MDVIEASVKAYMNAINKMESINKLKYKGAIKMGMTMTQKILAEHAGIDYVKPGQLISAKLDLVLGMI
jgi:hypothetical protein